MPVYEFKDRCTGERFEEVYASWRDAGQTETNPRTGCVGDRVPSRTATPIVMNEARLELRAQAKQGIVPYEAGMKEHAARARAAKEQREEKVLDQTIESVLREH